MQLLFEGAICDWRCKKKQKTLLQCFWISIHLNGIFKFSVMVSMCVFFSILFVLLFSRCCNRPRMKGFSQTCPAVLVYFISSPLIIQSLTLTQSPLKNKILTHLVICCQHFCYHSDHSASLCFPSSSAVALASQCVSILPVFSLLLLHLAALILCAKHQAWERVRAAERPHQRRLICNNN